MWVRFPPPAPGTMPRLNSSCAYGRPTIRARTNRRSLIVSSVEEWNGARFRVGVGSCPHHADVVKQADTPALNPGGAIRTGSTPVVRTICPSSSDGQSSGPLIRLSQVRVLSGVPYFDEVPERLKGADCKSVIRRFESGPHLHKNPAAAAVSLTREIELRQGFVTYKSTPCSATQKEWAALKGSPFFLGQQKPSLCRFFQLMRLSTTRSTIKMLPTLTARTW